MATILGAGYYLHKKKLRLGVFTVVVDYFQVVAMFARTRVAWPPSIVAIFNALSAFSLNIEITAPECAVPNVSVEQKLNLVLALPLVLCSLIVFSSAVHGVWSMAIQGAMRKKTLQSSLAASIGPLITLLYFMYLLVARQALDIFNCSPTVPPDGNLYMSGMTEIVCWSPTHNRLIPLAATAVIVYVIGFPVWVGWHLRRSRDTIRVAQLARAHGTSMQHLLSKVSEFDTRFSRLFWLFKPSTASFWVVVILFRKFGIAFAALMFRTTPTFMMAVCLLVLFGSFALQTKFEPFMGVSDYDQVVQDFELARAIKSPMALRLKAMLDASQQQTDSGTSSTKHRGNRGISSMQAGEMSTTHRERVMMMGTLNLSKGKRGALQIPLSPAFKALMSLNPIESVLLGSAILVNLLGMMFLSARFQGDQRQYYETEYNVLAYGTVFVLISSMVFAFVMLTLDVLSVMCPRWANHVAQMLLCSQLRKAAQRRAAGRESMVGRNTSMGLQVNPMTQGKGRAAVSLEHLMSSKAVLVAQLRNGLYPNEEQYKLLAEAAVDFIGRSGVIRQREVSFAKPRRSSISGGGPRRNEFTQSAARSPSAISKG
jgi:hypothetical protein